MKDNQPVVVLWSDEDGGLIADVPDLRSCSVRGETPKEVLRDVLVAPVAWLEIAHRRSPSLPVSRECRHLLDIARQAEPVGTCAS